MFVCAYVVGWGEGGGVGLGRGHLALKPLFDFPYKFFLCPTTSTDRKPERPETVTGTDKKLERTENQYGQKLWPVQTENQYPRLNRK